MIKGKRDMKRKTLLMMAILMLTSIGSTFFSACRGRQSHLLGEAERLALGDPDSAATLLAEVDTAKLDESDGALYALTRMLILEEQWQRHHADTTLCMLETDEEWLFNRESSTMRDSLDEIIDRLMADSALLRAYHYYYDKSIGGVTNNKTDLRHFGRVCYALSRHYDDSDTLLQADQLFHLAIHCAEASGDYATAFRAYHQWGVHQVSHHPLANNDIYWSFKQALDKFVEYRKGQEGNDSNQGDAQWLLTMLNDYGRAYLEKPVLDPRCFSFLIQAASYPSQFLHTPMPHAAMDSVVTLLDSVWGTPLLPFNDYTHFYSSGQAGHHFTREAGVWKGGFEYARDTWASQNRDSVDVRTSESCQKEFDNDMRRAATHFDIGTNTHLAPGYAKQSAQLQARLMPAVLTIFLLVIALLLLLFMNWRKNIERKHQAAQTAQQQEAERAAEEARHLAELLQQKDALIATLRGHIIDKSEILEMLEPTMGKRTIINAQNWREIEATLDTADHQFVSRLRKEHPTFSEDDIRLCMLVRLKISNAALSSIYAISVSAVQHRKQKLKKDGFGMNDPEVTLDQIIDNC